MTQNDLCHSTSPEKKYVFHDITYLAGRNKKNIKQHLFDPVNNKKFR